MRVDISAESAGKKTDPIEIDPGGAKQPRVDARQLLKKGACRGGSAGASGG